MVLPMSIAPVYLPPCVDSRLDQKYAVKLHLDAPVAFFDLRQFLGAGGTFLWGGAVDARAGRSPSIVGKNSSQRCHAVEYGNHNHCHARTSGAGTSSCSCPFGCTHLRRRIGNERLCSCLSMPPHGTGSALVQAQVGSQNQYFWWAPIWFIGTLALVTGWKSIGLSEGYTHKG